MMNDNFEFVTVNDNLDVWMVDYDNEIAVRSSTVTLDDLKTNDNTFVKHNDSIIDFLEGKRYFVDESKYNENAFMFRKVNIKRVVT